MYNKMSNIHVNKDKIRCDSKQKQIKSNTRWEVEFLAKTSEHTMVSSFEQQTAEISSSSSAELETVQKKMCQRILCTFPGSDFFYGHPETSGFSHTPNGRHSLGILDQLNL